MRLPVGFLRDLIYGPEPGPLLRAVDEKPPREWPDLTIEGRIARTRRQRESRRSRSPTRWPCPRSSGACSSSARLIAQFQPIAYRGGVPVPEQPRLLTQPAPFGTRYQFLYQTIYSQLAMPGSAGTGGDAYWLIVDRDDEGMARAAIVLDPAEVTVSWDDRRFLPVYAWRGEPVGPPDLVHLTIGRPPGELHGRSPLVAGLPALAVVAAAEAYALGFFGTSGVPSVDDQGPRQDHRRRGRRSSRRSGWRRHPRPTPRPRCCRRAWRPSTRHVDAQTRAAAGDPGLRRDHRRAPAGHPRSPAARRDVGARRSPTTTRAARSTSSSGRPRCPSTWHPSKATCPQLMPRTQTVRFDTGRAEQDRRRGPRERVRRRRSPRAS